MVSRMQRPFKHLVWILIVKSFRDSENIITVEERLESKRAHQNMHKTWLSS